jgi:hypothetical protein
MLPRVDRNFDFDAKRRLRSSCAREGRYKGQSLRKWEHEGVILAGTLRAAILTIIAPAAHLKRSGGKRTLISRWALAQGYCRTNRKRPAANSKPSRDTIIKAAG